MASNPISDPIKDPFDPVDPFEEEVEDGSPLPKDEHEDNNNICGNRIFLDRR